MAGTGHDIKTDPPGMEMTVPDNQRDPDPEEPMETIPPTKKVAFLNRNTHK